MREWKDELLRMARMDDSIDDPCYQSRSQMFMAGECRLFAYAHHSIFGGQVYQMNDDNTPLHVYTVNVVGDRTLVSDYLGVSYEEDKIELLSEYYEIGSGYEELAAPLTLSWETTKTKRIHPLDSKILIEADDTTPARIRKGSIISLAKEHIKSNLDVYSPHEGPSDYLSKEIALQLRKDYINIG